MHNGWKMKNFRDERYIISNVLLSEKMIFLIKNHYG